MEPLDEIAAVLAAQRHNPHADEATFFGALKLGDALPDVEVQFQGHPEQMDAHTGGAFQLLYFVREDGLVDMQEQRTLHALLRLHPAVLPLLVSEQGVRLAGFETLLDAEGDLARRCDARAGTAYLLSPYRRVLGRWRRLVLSDVQTVLDEVVSSLPGRGGHAADPTS